MNLPTFCLCSQASPPGHPGTFMMAKPLLPSCIFPKAALPQASQAPPPHPNPPPKESNGCLAERTQGICLLPLNLQPPQSQMPSPCPFLTNHSPCACVIQEKIKTRNLVKPRSSPAPANVNCETVTNGSKQWLWHQVELGSQPHSA